MTFKEELIKLKNKLLKLNQEQQNNEQNNVKKDVSNIIDPIPIEYFDKSKSIYLDDKIDWFINWYCKNIVKGHYIDMDEYHELIELRNFIEKMAVWYELRYPSYEVNRLMHCRGQELTEVSKEMFIKNPYIKDFIDESTEVKYLDWDEFYNTSSFINSLPYEEYWYLAKPTYRALISLEPSSIMDSRDFAYIHSSPDGKVIRTENIKEFTYGKINDEDILNMHLKDVLKLFKEKNINLSENNQLEETIKEYEKYIYFKDELLNSVMYRIIERGGNRIGPRRGFIFAKEFNRNIDIPMMYAVDTSDPGLRTFMNEYLKSGGRKDLICYENYFRKNNQTILTKTTVRKLVRDLWNNAATKYTKEEDELHQRLVDTLNSQIDEKTLKKEKIKHLRLTRKLKKSKNPSKK